MGRYQRLPVNVDAVKYDRNKPGIMKEILALVPGARFGPAHVTLPSGDRAEHGWWIVRDKLGNVSTVPDIVFQASYQALTAEQAQVG